MIMVLKQRKIKLEPRIKYYWATTYTLKKQGKIEIVISSQVDGFFAFGLPVLKWIQQYKIAGEKNRSPITRY